MKNKISCILICKGDIDVSEITNGEYGGENAEKSFDILHLKNPGNLGELYDAMYTEKCPDAIITVGDFKQFEPMVKLPYEIRKKWTHTDMYKPQLIGHYIIETFMMNISRDKNVGNELFSIFTCTHNTPKEYLDRLYSSLRKQTYKEWDWWILDDSDNDSVIETIGGYRDFRIHVIRNSSHHGNIGLNKRTIAMACDGDYLLEVDHDDELTPDCLELLYKAYILHPDVGFVYSKCLEEINGIPIVYGDGWGFGYGILDTFVTDDGKKLTYSATPDVNAVTIRTIYAQPNHIRSWRKDVYHKIDGHNITLSVLDDQDLIIRTFLNTKMCKVDKVLYIQHEGTNERGQETGDTAQSKRFNEIQRTTWILKNRYDRLIHERVLTLGHNDPVWNSQYGASFLEMEHEKLPPINYIYKP